MQGICPKATKQESHIIRAPFTTEDKQKIHFFLNEADALIGVIYD